MNAELDSPRAKQSIKIELPAKHLKMRNNGFPDIFCKATIQCSIFLLTILPISTVRIEILRRCKISKLRSWKIYDVIKFIISPTCS